MTTLTAEQHTALLAAKDALRDKHVAAAARGDLESEAYLDQQYRVVRDLITTAQFDTLTAPMRAAGIDFDALTGGRP